MLCTKFSISNKIYMYVHIYTVWVTKKFPFFETRYHAMVILRSVFVSVPFCNFPFFLLLCQYFKSTAQRTVKNGKKNGAKNGVKTAMQRVFSTALFSNYCIYLSACTSIKTSKSLDDSLEYLPSAAVPKFLSYVSTFSEK